MKTLIAKVRNFLQEEDGVTAVEYGLIAGIVSITIIAGLNLAGPALGRIFNSIGNALNTANP